MWNRCWAGCCQLAPYQNYVEAASLSFSPKLPCRRWWWCIPVNPGTWEAEAGGSRRVWGQPGIHSKTLSPIKKAPISSMTNENFFSFGVKVLHFGNAWDFKLLCLFVLTASTYMHFPTRFYPLNSSWFHAAFATPLSLTKNPSPPHAPSSLSLPLVQCLARHT